MTRAPRNRRSAIWIAALLVCAASCARDPQDREDETAARAEAAQLFAEPAVYGLELTIERSAMAELARAPKDWVRAKLKIGRLEFADVGVRFKGHRSMRSWAHKPALKLDFDKYKHKGRRILGLRGLVLNNLVDDPSMLREQLGSRVYAALGVPAPRATYAELTLNGERFGLYALLEAPDETLLDRHFESSEGPLYEGEYGCDLYEQDVWGFEQDSGEDPDRASLRALARAVKGPVAEWFLGDAPIFDRTRVMNFLVANTLLADFDGYRHGHNYRLYRDPKTERWSFIPWGFDRILKRDFGVFDSAGLVARKCFEDAACRLGYVRALKSGLHRFEQLELSQELARFHRTITPFVERDPRRPYSRVERDEAVEKLAKFVAERPAVLAKQLGCWDGANEIDADGDGFGCLDCDDANAAVHPRAAESCDGVDNDCSGHADDDAACGCPLQATGESGYALCDFPLTFWEAEQHCHSLGHTLARIDSREVLQTLHTSVQSTRKGEWWVGSSDQANEGDYRWPDQSRPARGLWARGEPDHYVCGQHCAAMRSGRKAGLRDMHCATPAPFVCSVSDPAELSRLTPSAAKPSPP